MTGSPDHPEIRADVSHSARVWNYWTHLSRFDRGERLSLMTVDQTVLRAAGLTGTAVLPVMATGHPAAGYVVGGIGRRI